MFLNPPPAPTPAGQARGSSGPRMILMNSSRLTSRCHVLELFSSVASCKRPDHIKVTTLLPSKHQCSPTAMDISPAPSRTIFNVFKGKILTRSHSRTSDRELGNFWTPSANDSLMASTKSRSGERLQRSALPSEWMNSFPRSKVEFVSNFMAMPCPVLNVFSRYFQL